MEQAEEFYSRDTTSILTHGHALIFLLSFPLGGDHSKKHPRAWDERAECDLHPAPREFTVFLTASAHFIAAACEQSWEARTSCSWSPLLPQPSSEAIKSLLETPSAPTGRAEKRVPWDGWMLKASGSFHRRLRGLSGAVMDYCHLAASGLMIPRSEGRIPEGKVSSRGHSVRLVAF